MLARLFQPDGEVQTKARLYDEKVTEPGVEGAARVKNIVKEYAAKVEETLVGFRALVAEVLARCPPGPQPEVGETSRRGGGVPLASSELLAAFHLSQDAPRTGDLDRMMGAGNSTPEQTSRPVREFGTGSGKRPAGGELSRFGEPGGGDGGDRYPTG